MSFPPLAPPHVHGFNAAQGWLELGNAAEAACELDALPAAIQEHPDVLELRWAVAARQQRWEDALQTARRLTAAAPERCAGWIDQSYALHELKRTAEALECLLCAAEKFPRVGVIPYNLACYTCQLDRMDEARRWLAKAGQLSGGENIRRAALNDPDLKPLWPELGNPENTA